MKSFKNKLTLIFGFLLILNQASSINISGENAPNIHFSYRYYSDNPYSLNISNTQSLLNFVKLYNSFQDLKILKTSKVISLEDIDNHTRTNKSIFFDFSLIGCFIDNECKSNKDINYIIDLKNFRIELIKELKNNHISYYSKDYNLYFLIFNSFPFTKNKISDINKENFPIKLYLNPDLFQNWLSIISKYNVIKLEKELEIFNHELNNISPHCSDELLPYCLVRNNNTVGIKKYIDEQNKNKTKSIKLDLILDFAYKTNNHNMVEFLTKLQLKSIHFPDDRSKLYMAAYYNYKFVIDSLLSNTKSKSIDYEYLSGVTALGVAIGSNSFDVVKTLIDKGAIKKGDFSNYYMFNNVDLFKENKDLVFKLLLEKYKSKEIPDLLRVETLMIMRTSGKNTINWLTKLFNEQPVIFSSVFVYSEEYARQALIESSYFSNPDVFNFLVEHGVNMCLAFDKSALRSLNNRKLTDKSHWLNSWYKEFLKKCTKTPEN